MTTRAAAEAELIARAGTWMTAAGLDGVTVDGTNASLDSPLGYALRAVAADAVTDVGTSDLDMLYDIAEWRLLENIVQNYKKVDGKAGPVEGKADQLGQRMERRLSQMRTFVQATYGIGGTSSTLSGGTLTLNFAETSEA
jgi:hypothetical protein